MLAKKKDIVRRLAGKVNCTLLDAELFYNNILDVLHEFILTGHSIRFPFGSFHVRTRAPKRIYNIKTKSFTPCIPFDVLTFKPNRDTRLYIKRRSRERWRKMQEAEKNNQLPPLPEV